MIKNKIKKDTSQQTRNRGELPHFDKEHLQHLHQLQQIKDIENEGGMCVWR